MIVRFDAVGAGRHGIWYHYTTPASFGSALSSHLSSSSSSQSFHPPPNLPTRISCIMSSDGRSRRRELVEEAYNLQVKAGLMASRMHYIPFWIFWFLPCLSPSSSLSLSMRSFFLVRYLTLLYTFSQLTHMTRHTERSAIWRIWTRLGDFRPSYLAHFPVSCYSCSTITALRDSNCLSRIGMTRI